MSIPKQTPPRLAQRLLCSFLKRELAEEVLGDLEENFYLTLNAKSALRARINYWYQVIHYLRPFAIRRIRSVHVNQYDMFQNYMKVSWRNLFRNMGYSSINIGGLGVGIAMVILIGLWINDEVSFNTFHQNHKRIGQVMRTADVEGKHYTTSWLPNPLADELRTKFGSDFKHVTRMSQTGDEIFASGEKKLAMQGAFIDPNGVEMFTIPLHQEDKSVLDDPHAIIISTAFAKAFFGDEDPINKTMTMRGSQEVKVTGVYTKLPHNTEFHHVDFFAPFELYLLFNPWVNDQGFGNNFLQVYTELQPASSFETVSSRIKDAILNNVQDDKNYVSVNPQIFLHPMEQWHLWGNWEEDGTPSGVILYVKLFGIIGAFILLLACINFMNLSTARSEKRAKEVGIRKSIGSVRNQLIGQFFSESFMIVIIAFIVALGLATLALGGFNAIAGKQISMPWSNVYFWVASMIFIIITGVISGSYPAFYLSSFSPVKILKGTFRAGRFASVPRKVLVVIQFTVSVTMIIGTSIVYRQVQHAKDRPVGYDREGLLMIPMLTGEFHSKYDALKTELIRSGAVMSVAQSLGQTTQINSSNGGFTWRGMKPGFVTDFGTLWVSADYGKTVGWKFIHGRDFDEHMASDSVAIVMNVSAAKIIGMENPVGEEITWAPGWDKTRKYHVIGLIDDMVMKSPYDPAMPVMFFLGDRVSVINLKMNPQMSTSDALSRIESVFKNVITSAPFTYKFADQEYALKFASEERIGKLAAVFAVLAVLISCLGLFGLSSFVAEQKTKEIGIRKVVGASVFSLWKLLSKDFVVLVMISALIAIPLAWYFMNDWLSAYQYRTTLSWWIFGFAIAGSVALTLLTVSYQAIKAALMNPVKSLRSE
ncbi:MAG TPA: ABC transporter permease [Ohtaekwangia sp.]